MFVAAHYADQGVAGDEQALITGLVFSTIFAYIRRIFFLMCAQAAFESKAAHFILG